MRERLAELKAEFAKGQQQLQALDEQRAHLRDTLLRISGAIQVLEELLADTPVSPVGTALSRLGEILHSNPGDVEQNEQESSERVGKPVAVAQ